MKTERRRVGDEAESQAERYLLQQGYALCARNFQTRYGELDLVVEKGELLCFVEVRMRARRIWGEPALTVTHAKQRRVVKAALYYLHTRRVRDRAIRFDVVSVVGRGGRTELLHIPNAFDAGM